MRDPKEEEEEEEDMSGHLENLNQGLFAADDRTTPYRFTKTRTFWVLWFTFFFNGHGIYFLASWIKVFGEDLVSATDAQIAVALSIGSIINGTGRILWGHLCDRFSFFKCMAACSLGLSFFTATLGIGHSALFFCIWVTLAYFCLGGNFALFPAAIAVECGPKHVPNVYGALFMAQSVAYLTGQSMAEILHASLSTHQLAWVVSGMCFIGFMINMLHLTENTRLRSGK